MPRLFFALWPDSSTREQILEYAKACQWNKAKSVDAQKLHVTVKYLGEVDQMRLPDLFNTEVDGIRPFELTLTHAAHWANGVVALLAESTQLHALHEHLDRAVQRLGLPGESRTFKPHVTLARTKERLNLPPVIPIPWKVNAVCLVESKPSIPKAAYQVLKSIPLTYVPA
jgi:2'-5' RNA ligase